MTPFRVDIGIGSHEFAAPTLAKFGMGREALSNASVHVPKFNDMIRSPQTIAGGGLLVAGALLFVIARRQMKSYVLGQVPLVSPRAKHLFGLVMMWIGFLGFLSQFVSRG